MILTRPPFNGIRPAVASIPLTDLQLWLNPFSLSALSNGDPIGTWPDSSGHGNDATATLTARPTYNSSGGSNNQPFITFDGTSDGMTLPNFLTSFTAGHSFMVVKADNDPPAGNQSVHPMNQWGSDSQTSHYPFTDGSIYDAFGTTARKTVGNPATTLAQWNCYEALSKSGEWTAWLNGTQIFTTATNTVGFGTAPRLCATGVGQFFGGTAEEFIFYGADIGSTTIAAVKNYLSTTYALTIA